jgi:hypothetical protein
MMRYQDGNLKKISLKITTHEQNKKNAPLETISPNWDCACMSRCDTIVFTS